MKTGLIAVIDIGKTNAKLAIVDPATGQEADVVTTPNTVVPGPPWPHFDVDRIWDFLLDGLAHFQARHGISAISITTHGASIALLDAAGDLAAPILDYEHSEPDDVGEAYDAIRPEFVETGSPRLSAGLNVGAQLFWQFGVDPTLRDRTAQIVTYPQYWGHRLTGVATTDVTSLGCHTDLWNPFEGAPSSLVDDLGVSGKLAPVRRPGDVLGPVLPAIAARCGLAPETQVYCGIHDSNASLLPHLLSADTPFGVVSTGTWVIVMGVGARPQALDPTRDTLVNVDALGDPVPSARFMGGREYDLLTGGVSVDPTPEDMAAVLADQIMVLPAVVPETGPFQGRVASWRGEEPPMGSGTRHAAVGYYLALMTAECLRLVGQEGKINVEGPFARNACFLEMLGVATGRPVYVTESATGTSQGAALLVGKPTVTVNRKRVSAPIADKKAMLAAYAAAWSNCVGAGGNGPITDL